MLDKLRLLLACLVGGPRGFAVDSIGISVDVVRKEAIHRYFAEMMTQAFDGIRMCCVRLRSAALPSSGSWPEGSSGRVKS